jgi:hypothetical protein
MTEVLFSPETLALAGQPERVAALHENIHPERHISLAQYLLYPDDSELAQLVQERAQIIAGDEPAVTQMVHSDEPIAFTTGGVVVLSDGLIKLFDVQEELDAVLAHELTHDHASHHGIRQEESRSITHKIGIVRAQETGADYGAYERLDELGINVAGIPRAFRKLSDANEAEPQSHQELTIEDYEHGTTVDRAINAEELLRVIDVQNARMEDFTPLRLSEGAFDRYVNDADLIDEARRSDNPHLLRYVAERQCSTDIRPEVFLSAKEKIELHTKALKLAEPGLTESQAENYTMLAIATAYLKSDPREEDDYLHRSKSIGNRILDERVMEWLEGHESYEDIADTFGDDANAVFAKLGIRPSDKALGLILDIGMEEVLAKQPAIEMGAIDQLVTRLQLRSPHHELLSLAVFRELEKRGTVSSPPSGLAEFFADGYLPAFFTGRFERSISRNSDIEPNLLEKAVIGRRVEKVQSFQDPLELESYLHERDINDIFSRWLPRPLETNDEESRERSLRGSYHVLDSADYSEPWWAAPLYHPVIEQAFCSMLRTMAPREFKTYIDDALQGGRADMAAAGRLTELYFRVDQSEGQDMIRFRPRLRQLSAEEPLDEQLLLLAYVEKANTIRDVFLESIDMLPAEAGELARLVDVVAAERSAYVESGYKLEAFDAAHLKDTQLVWDVLLDTIGDAESYDNARQLAMAMSKLPMTALVVSLSKDDGREQISTTGSYDKLMTKVLEVAEEDRDEQWYFTVAMLSSLSPDTRVRLEVTNAALVALCERLSFEEAFSLLDEQTRFLPSISKRAAWEYLAEQKADTVEQLEMVSEVIKRDVEAFLSNSQLIGRLALFDNVFVPNYVDARFEREGLRRRLPQHDNLEALKLMLLSGEDETALAEYMLSRWLFRYTATALSSSVSLDRYFDFTAYRYLHHSHKAAQLASWIKDLPVTGSYETFESALDRAFMAGSATKYYLLRKMLVGEGGVLMDAESRQALIELLETTMLEDDTGGGVELFRNVSNGLVSTATPDELYRLTAPILIDLSLRYPAERKKFTELAAQEAEQLLTQYGVIREGMDEEVVRRHINQLGTKIYGLMRGYLPEQAANGEVVSKAESPDQQLLELFIGEQTAGSGRMTTAQFARTIGMQSGALGVRMLQLAGQYFDLPPEDATVFEDAYDNVKGQTRVQALRVLKREAKLHPETAELLDNIVRFGRRIGGGSLMTVYDVELRGGRRVALSIQNPNVEYNLGKMTAILERSIEYTQAAYPNSTVYPALGAILGQVKQWIRDELTDPDFELKDARYRLENDDSLYGEAGMVAIHVPTTIPTGTRKIRCEDYVEGTNLNGLEVADVTDIENGQIVRDDFRRIVSKLAKNYVPQLLVHGLAHSDIHPGNFRVMDDARTIAVFDRYNLLKLDEREKAAIGAVAGHLVAGNTALAINELLDYLHELPENTDKGPAFAELRQELSVASEGGVGSLMTMLVKLQQASITVPLKLTLVARNFGSLNKLAVKAGFSGVAEALAA